MARMATVSMAFLGLVLVGATTGCGSKTDDSKEQASRQPTPGAKSMDDVKQEAAQLQRPTPGQYKQTVQVTRMDVPGLPSEAAEQMKAMMAKTKVSTFCLTAAEAEKGYRDMFEGIGKGKECTYSRFEVDGGKLDAQMDCKSGDQGRAVMKLAGTVTAEGSDVTVVMDMSGGPGPNGQMNMAMHTTTQRIGDCK
ncbi:uncharacterized protein DUF3617 [Novosphingobium sp. PhB165]|uniref:DUF3617 domain-containing protein n=1 Tax=Novosphingobium sp. PhB165 TaxID=2485105 RepID=UPI00104544B7|nr:DUF3617 domain-containing protein [Novosphingobium sp. PhB165]TCM18924.1 uncharacterized protein DUF3617 [Novosphingobium sp. PhB165]